MTTHFRSHPLFTWATAALPVTPIIPIRRTALIKPMRAEVARMVVAVVTDFRVI